MTGKEADHDWRNRVEGKRGRPQLVKYSQRKEKVTTGVRVRVQSQRKRGSCNNWRSSTESQGIEAGHNRRNAELEGRETDQN